MAPDPGMEVALWCEHIGLSVSDQCRSVLRAVFAPGLEGAITQSGIDVRADADERTGIFACCALGWLFLDWPPPVILWTMASRSAVRNAFTLLATTIKGNGELARRVRRLSRASGDEGIELHAWSGLQPRLLVRERGWGRGMAVDRLIIDDVGSCTESQIAALLPTTAAARDPQVLYGYAPDSVIQ